ncbi:basic membrane lipoprotein Med (substrate-binding protein (PBP1-ABC) superfamily) [Lactococcus lactis]
MIIDSNPSKNITNLSSALFAENEGAYLAGVAEAKTTKANVKINIHTDASKGKTIAHTMFNEETEKLERISQKILKKQV